MTDVNSKGARSDKWLGIPIHHLHLWVGVGSIRSYCKFFIHSSEASGEKIFSINIVASSSPDLTARTRMASLCCQSVERHRRCYNRVRSAATTLRGLALTCRRLYMIYLPLRLYGVAVGDLVISDYAISVLSCESSLLFPRYAWLCI
jgi:hypothetical protein